MRRLLVLLPLLLAGCRPGRQAAVSNTGGVASTVEGGTYVAGRGRVGEGGDDVAWSPDGSSLAIATKDGVVFWPKGERVPKMRGPLAWSPFGDRLAGVVEDHVVVRDLATGGTKATTLADKPLSLRWTPDGRLVGAGERALQMDGGPSLTLKEGACVDAVATADGAVVYLTWSGLAAKRSKLLSVRLGLGRWDPATGQASVEPAGKADEIFGAASSRRLDAPMRFALAPDGRRYAAAGLRIEAGPRVLARLTALADVTKPTLAQRKELEALLKSARLTSVVTLVSPDGRSRGLWSVPVEAKEGGPTDLAWSPDGKWLAIAQKDGTVRVSTE